MKIKFSADWHEHRFHLQVESANVETHSWMSENDPRVRYALEQARETFRRALAGPVPVIHGEPVTLV